MLQLTSRAVQASSLELNPETRLCGKKAGGNTLALSSSTVVPVALQQTTLLPSVTNSNIIIKQQQIRASALDEQGGEGKQAASTRFPESHLPALLF